MQFLHRCFDTNGTPYIAWSSLNFHTICSGYLTQITLSFYFSCSPPLNEAQSMAHKRSRSISGGEGEPDFVELAAMVTKRQKNKRVAIKKENKVDNPTTPNSEFTNNCDCFIQWIPTEKQWITCANCKGNPKVFICLAALSVSLYIPPVPPPQGMKCVHNLCKVCCRIKCRTERLDCPGTWTHIAFSPPVRPIQFTIALFYM